MRYFRAKVNVPKVSAGEILSGDWCANYPELFQEVKEDELLSSLANDLISYSGKGYDMNEPGKTIEFLKKLKAWVLEK